MRKRAHINSEFLTGYRVRIYPTDNQRREINKNIHAARAIYNLGLEMQNNAHADGRQYIGFYDMITEFARMRNYDPDKSWLKSISVGTMRETLHNLDTAYKRFFKGQNRHPKFKSRKSAKQSFSIRSDRTSIQGEYIRVSGLSDYLILAKNHQIPSNARMHNTTISFDGMNYWFSCTIEREPIDISDIPKTEPIGIDVGIVNLLTTSDGEFYKYSDTTKLDKRLKRLQRRLSKDYQQYYQQSLDTRTKYEDIPKSKNHYKRLIKRLKTIQTISHKRMNDIHTATKRVVDKNPSAIVIETISVKHQVAENPWIRKYAPHMAFYETQRQLQYKAALRGIPVIKADASYPSSQLCSCCGARGKLNHRKFTCPICGHTEDRDLNAAKNLRSLAYQ